MKPQNITQTIRKLMHYMGNHAILFVLVGILVALSALGNLLGTYMIRPVVNEVLSTGLDKALLQIILMAFIFLIGVLSALGYTQIMAVAAQKVVKDIRQDLFHVLQKLPLSCSAPFGCVQSNPLRKKMRTDLQTYTPPYRKPPHLHLPEIYANSSRDSRKPKDRDGKQTATPRPLIPLLREYGHGYQNIPSAVPDTDTPLSNMSIRQPEQSST